jgi:predicted DNA-binding transcriptional regulator YafY
MSRAQRLLHLMQVLRRHRAPVSGARLADETGVSLRTLYRDIATLQSHGATIEGEPGVGYLLRPGFLLPPLMFSPEEIEALVLGARWVEQRTDAQLGDAAAEAIAKIAAVLPAELRHELESHALLIGPAKRPAAAHEHLAAIRDAIRRERKLALDYRDAQGKGSRRTVWPFALGFFEEARVMVAWCETREEFRHFRVDRIAQLQPLQARYPRRRQALLKAWRTHEGIAAGRI